MVEKKQERKLKTHCGRLDALLTNDLEKETGIEVGFPFGEICGVIGEPMIGKSPLIAQLAISCNLLNRPSLIVNTENKPLDPYIHFLAKRFDVKPNIKILTPTTLEELMTACGRDLSITYAKKTGQPKPRIVPLKEYELLTALEEMKNCGFLGIDSWSMPLKNYLVQLQQTYGVRATIEAQLFGQLSWLTKKYNMVTAITHHTIVDITQPLRFQASTVNPWGGPLIKYNTNTILEIKKGLSAVAKAMGVEKEFVRRIKRKRYISTVESPDEWVWCKENYGYTDIPQEIYTRIPELLTKGKKGKEEKDDEDEEE